jgi:hypothetical protein
MKVSLTWLFTAVIASALWALKADKATVAGEYNKLGSYSVAYVGYDGNIEFPAIEMLCNHTRTIDWFPISKAIFKYFGGDDDKKTMAIINAYTQFETGRDSFTGGHPVDYVALRMVMRKINRDFQDKKIGIPEIGCGLAGGEWDTVKAIIEDELTHVDATIVHWQPRKVKV